MKKLTALMITALLLVAVAKTAFAGFAGEVYVNPSTGPLANISSAKALSSRTVANGGVIPAMSYDKASFVFSGGGNTVLMNFSGTGYVWGSNDFIATTTSTAATANGTWAVVKKIEGDATSATYDSLVPYKYYAVTYAPDRDILATYTGTESRVGTKKFRVNCKVYLYRSANE